MKYIILEPWDTHLNTNDEDEMWFDRSYLIIMSVVSLIGGISLGILISLVVLA